MSRCRGCGKDLGSGEASIEYCNGYCADCYDWDLEWDEWMDDEVKIDYDDEEV